MVRLNIAGSEMLILNDVEDIDELVSSLVNQSSLVRFGDQVPFSWSNVPATTPRVSSSCMPENTAPATK